MNPECHLCIIPSLLSQSNYSSVRHLSCPSIPVAQMSESQYPVTTNESNLWRKMCCWCGIESPLKTAQQGRTKKPKCRFYGCRLFRVWINLWFPGYYSFFIPGILGIWLQEEKECNFFTGLMMRLAIVQKRLYHIFTNKEWYRRKKLAQRYVKMGLKSRLN